MSTGVNKKANKTENELPLITINCIKYWGWINYHYHYC